MIAVIRIYLLYLQTVLIIAGPSVTNRMQVSNTFTVLNKMPYFVPQKQILGDLKTNLAIEMSQNNTVTRGK